MYSLDNLPPLQGKHTSVLAVPNRRFAGCIRATRDLQVPKVYQGRRMTTLFIPEGDWHVMPRLGCHLVVGADLIADYTTGSSYANGYRYHAHTPSPDDESSKLLGRFWRAQDLTVTPLAASRRQNAWVIGQVAFNFMGIGELETHNGRRLAFVGGDFIVSEIGSIPTPGPDAATVRIVQATEMGAEFSRLVANDDPAGRGRLVLDFGLEPGPDPTFEP